MTTIDQARQQFPGTGDCIYLENSARCLLPIDAREAAMRYYDARLAGGVKESDAVFNAAEVAREHFAGLVGAAPDEVTLTRNVTDGLNILVTALPLEAGRQRGRVQRSRAPQRCLRALQHAGSLRC